MKDKNRYRGLAFFFVLAITLLFPLIIYGFQYVYAVVHHSLSEVLPFLDDLSEAAEIDWFELFLTALFAFLAACAGSASEKICPTREGVRYLAAAVLSALMTAVEAVLLFRWLRDLSIPDHQRWFTLQIIIAQVSYTAAMAAQFRSSGTLAMIFRRKYAAVFAERKTETQYTSCAYVKLNRPLVKPDHSFDSKKVLTMTEAVCKAVPSYAAVENKIILSMRLEHLKALYNADLSLFPEEQGKVRIVCRTYEEVSVPVEMVTMLREVKL